MNDYIIFTDSTTDLPPGLAAELGLEIIPFGFCMEGRDYSNHLDGRELGAHDFYDMLRAGKTSSTSLVTSFYYLEAFESHLKAGKDILYLCFSSGLSGSYAQALTVAGELMERYAGRKIIVIDTLCASMGQGLLAYYAAKWKKSGKTMRETADCVRDIIPKLSHWFTVDDLAHLRRGGRISGASAVIGTILGIKPILHVDDNGKLVPVDKVRGRVKSLEYLADRMKNTMIDPKDQTVFISHGDSPEDANVLAGMIRERVGSKEFVVSEIGPVIGTHSGPGTIALFFLGEKR